jgi:uncharacterized protein YgiM (DUF1202 family)
VVAAVVVVSVVVTLLLIYRHREATPEATPSTTVPTEESPGEMVTIEPSNMPTPVPTTPPPTLTPSPTATATPVPQSCQVLDATWVRAQPTDQSTGIAQLSAGDDVGVIGQVQDDDGQTWYLLAGYQGEAYIRAEMVQCHVS